jgi:hypothetical protein
MTAAPPISITSAVVPAAWGFKSLLGHLRGGDPHPGRFAGARARHQAGPPRPRGGAGDPARPIFEMPERPG